MAYIGKSPSQAVRNRYFFTASGGETSISSSQISGFSFSDGAYTDVYLNGVLLVAGTDYNTNTANTIAGLSALVASDIVEIVVYDTFSVFGGTFNGTINTTGLNVGSSTAVTAILDEDNMASNSATSLATQQSIKAYVDTQVATVPVGDITEVTAGTGLTGGGASGAVTLNVVGGTGITANADDIAIDATVATLAGTQTLTNKTLGATSVTADISFGDNDKAVFGAGSDLQIFHNASASYITDQGTGNLVLGGDAAILLQNSAHSANMLDAYNGGRVGLYHAGTLKAETTSSGIDVTGNAKLSGTGSILQFDKNGSGTDNVLYYDNSTASNNLYLGKDSSNIIYRTGGSEKVRITSGGNVGIGTAAPAHNVEIVATNAGSVNDSLQIRNNATSTGTGSRIRFINSTDANSDANGASIASVRTGNDNDLVFETENSEKMRILHNGRIGIGTTSPDALLQIEKSDSGTTIDKEPSSQSGPNIVIHNSNQTANNLSSVQFTNRGTNGVAETATAGIHVKHEAQGGTYSYGSMNFNVTNSAGSYATRLHISSDGNIGINTTSPTSASGGKVLAVETTANEHTNLVFNTANTGRNGIIEGRRTGRSGSERFAQINIQNDSDNGEIRFYTAPSGSDISERMRIATDGTVTGTRFFMQFPPSTPISNSGSSETTVYQNGALTSADGSLVNTPIPAKCKVLKMRCYVNNSLSGGGARVYVTQNGTAITGTNREIDVTQGTNMFEANNVNLTLDEGNRVGIKIILEPGASAAWYHVTLECEFIT